MKVKLLTSRSGAFGTQDRGDVIEVGAEEGPRMIAAGQAEMARDAKVERAIPATRGEKAVK